MLSKKSQVFIKGSWWFAVEDPDSVPLPELSWQFGYMQQREDEHGFRRIIRTLGTSQCVTTWEIM